MLRKSLLTLTLLFALPAFANAWYVNAKASGSGTITPAGNQSYATGVDSAEYAVAANPGNSLSRVTLDGYPLAANANGKYVVPYDATKPVTAFRYLVAYFNVQKLSITTSVPGGNGAIREDTFESLTNIPYGSSRQLLILPNPGCSIASLSAPNATSILDNADGRSKTVIYTNLQASQTVTAAFSLDAVVTANAGNDVTATGPGSGFAATLYGSATSNQGAITYAWSGTGLSFGTPAAAITTVYAAAAGDYTATLTVTSNGIVKTDTATVHVLDRTAYLEGLCTSCHNGSTPTIVADYNSSKHKITTYDVVVCQTCHDPNGTGHYTAAQPTTVCQGCHAASIQGANFAKSSHATSTHYPGITCVNCHNAHSTVASYGAGTATGCQTCHQPGSPYGIYSSNLVGKAPHYQTGTPDAGGYYPSASFITTGGATCADCHGHNNTINAGWAEGGHGDVNAAPWKSDASHNWNGQGTDATNYQVSPQKTNCIRCHTSRGFAQYWDSGFSNINKIYLTGTTLDKASAPLTCNGCHTSAEGTLRPMPAGYTKVKSFYGYSTVIVAPAKMVVNLEFTDNKNSNICLPCHSQRAAGIGIKALFAQAAFKQYSVGTNMYPHEAQPASIVDGKGGYEFSGGSFAYQDRMRHIRIGNYGTGTGYNNTGVTSGNCAGCHMTSTKTHSLEAVSKDPATGAITGIVSTTCAKCHPVAFTYQDVQAKKDEFNAAVTVLGNLLVQRGFTLDGVNVVPERKYLDMSMDKNGVKTKDNAIAEKNVGAWFNWYLFKTADKGGYVHNPAYSRRLINDSIDWLDDNVLNGSSAATIASQKAAGKIDATTASNAQAQLNNPGCLGCHFGTGSSVNGETIPGIEQAPHYNTNGALVPGQTFTQAQFVVAGAQCNNCHGIGHGTDSPNYSASKAAYPALSSVQGKGILKNYAESAHGEINGMAWTDYNFFNLTSRSACTPCHTTKGFVAAVESANANGGKIATPSFLGDTADTTKQVLACNACHSSTTWKSSVRTINGDYQAAMGGFSLTAPAYISYKNVGESNVCIPCHASRENGASINASTANFANTSFKNPHYLAASAVFYGQGGFQFYSSGVRYNTYGAAGKVGRTANWSHGKLGMDNYTTAALTNPTSTAFGTNKDNTGKVRGSGNKGQCVACHLGPTNTHTFGAFEVAKSTWGTNATNAKGCYGCHSGEDMEEVAVGEKALVDRSLDLLAYELEKYGLYFNNDKNPYFFTDATYATSATNWTTNPNIVTVTGKQTMGAAMNLKLLKAEKGSHVHNRSFMRALIADSLVYLQLGQAGIDADRTIKYPDVNQVINFSNYSAAISAPNSDRIAAGQSGSAVSISGLKGYLTRTSGGLFYRR